METKNLVSLADFNTVKRTQHQYIDVPNGIACPTCGNELVDSDKRCVLASDPPKLNIKCLNCNYSGYRLA